MSAPEGLVVDGKAVRVLRTVHGSDLDPGEVTTHKCKACGYERRTTTNRARTAGWRIGATNGGEHVAWCPSCWRGDPPAFRVQCLTCGWDSEEDRAENADVLDQAAAREWARDHQCEPDVRVERVTE